MPKNVNDDKYLDSPNVFNNRIRSDEFNLLVLGQHSFLSKWAVLIYLVILSLLLTLTWYIDYPNVIKARVTLLATNPPRELISRQTGRLVKLFVENGMKVSQGEILGFMESSAKPRQVLLLSAYLDSTILDLENACTQKIHSRFDYNFDSLGELQFDYHLFTLFYQQFCDYINDGYYLKRKVNLERELAYYQKNKSVLLNQKRIILQDLRPTNDNHFANESILKAKIILKQDDLDVIKKLHNNRLSIPQIETSLLTNEKQERDKQIEITELENRITQQKYIFQLAIHNMQKKVDEWKNNFILQSPITGTINFYLNLHEQPYLLVNKPFGFINPTNVDYLVEVYLPQHNFGKINVGQQVHLRFDAFPFQEFYYVSGKFIYISDFASDSGYLARIQLINGLTSNQIKMLCFQNGLKPEAQIITKDIRLMEQFYNNLISNVKR